MGKHTHGKTVALLLFTLVAAGTLPGLANEKEYGVYEFVVRKAQATYEQITSDLESTALKSGWNVLAVVDAGASNDCPYRARVFVLYDSLYAQQIMTANKLTGPFAVLDRVNLFQDEDGYHVSVVNPHSINRTIMMNDEKYEVMTEEHLLALRTMITSVVKGEVSTSQYGEIREKGYIGKTMGVIAGGSFDGKIEDEFVIPNGDLKDVAEKVRRGLSTTGREWGTHIVYQLDLPAYETVIFGTTGTPLDIKSFEIVGAGDDDARDGFKCPGIAHAAAYPLEVVVTKEDNSVKVRMVHPMFRMKMYFEDAGKWAFMKHMGMPGSIENELKESIKPALGLK